MQATENQPSSYTTWEESKLFRYGLFKKFFSEYFFHFVSIFQLDYTDASKHLTQALRKAPTTNVGFKEIVQTLNVTVQLLLGTTPERKLLFDPQFKRLLEPYFELTTGEGS